MIKQVDFFDYILNDKNADELLADANRICDSLTRGVLVDLDIQDYKYDPQIAVDELGIDMELVIQLVEDYVEQIIKSVVQFESYLETLKTSFKNHTAMDFTPFRELAHKNLGVARNLRIKDAEKLLYALMKSEDLDYLVNCLEALKVCAVKLNPECAYNTIRLIHVKQKL